MKRVPKYIKKFMGMDFRSVEGMDASFELSDFINPDIIAKTKCTKIKKRNVPKLFSQ